MNGNHCKIAAFFVQFYIVILMKNYLITYNSIVLLSHCHKTERIFLLILLNIGRKFALISFMRLFWISSIDNELLYDKTSCTNVYLRIFTLFYEDIFFSTNHLLGFFLDMLIPKQRAQLKP